MTPNNGPHDESESIPGMEHSEPTDHGGSEQGSGPITDHGGSSPFGKNKAKNGGLKSVLMVAVLVVVLGFVAWLGYAAFFKHRPVDVHPSLTQIVPAKSAPAKNTSPNPVQTSPSAPEKAPEKLSSNGSAPSASAPGMPSASASSLSKPVLPTQTPTLPASTMPGSTLPGSTGSVPSAPPVIGDPLASTAASSLAPVVPTPSAPSASLPPKDPLAASPAGHAAVDPLSSLANHGAMTAPASPPSNPPSNPMMPGNPGSSPAPAPASDPLASMSAGATVGAPASPAGSTNSTSLVGQASIDEIRTMIRDEVHNEIAPFNQRLSVLESRVNTQRADRALSDSKNSKNPGGRKEPGSQESSKYGRARATQHSERNRLEVLHRSAGAAAAPLMSAKPAPCHLQAVVPGRAWVKGADGSFQNYGIGDRWTDGTVITAIDPDGGVKGGGKTLCAASE